MLTDTATGTVGRPDVACEYGTAVDADAQRSRDAGFDDLAQSEQHVIFVVAGHGWRTGGEDQLATIGIDVGTQEG